MFINSDNYHDKIMNNRLLLIITFAFMLILSGCTKQVWLPNMYNLGKPFSDFGFDFTIKYPSNWKIIESSMVEKRDYMRIKQHMQASTNYWIPFISIVAPNEEAGVEVAGWGGKTWNVEEVEETARAGGTLVVKQERTVVSGHTAVYTHAKDERLKREIVQIDVISNDKLLTIQYTTSQDLFEKHKQEGLAIVESFETI